jgi:hypothetical protein
MMKRRVLLISAFALGTLAGGVRLYGQVDCPHPDHIGHGLVSGNAFAYGNCGDEDESTCWVQNCFVSGGGCQNASSGYVCDIDMPIDLCDNFDCE